MKTIISLFLFFLLSDISAQYYSPGIFEKSSFKELKKQLEHDDLEQLEVLFSTNNYTKLKPYIHKKLYKNVVKILTSINDSLPDINWELVTHYEIGSRGSSSEFSSYATKNVLEYRSKANKGSRLRTEYTIEYTYIVINASLLINSITFYTSGPFKIKYITYPQILEDYDDIAMELDTIDNWNYFEKKFTELKKTRKKLSPYQFEFTQSELNKSDISKSYGNLSWKLIFKKDYENAILSAQKGLSIDSTQRWINTNLALAYLLNNEYTKAESIYKQFLDMPFSKKASFKQIFSEDLNAAKKAGLENSDFDRIYLLINE